MTNSEKMNSSNTNYMKILYVISAFIALPIFSFSQITNGQINYELYVDQWRQSCDNDGFSADDNEVRVGLTTDANTAGTATWTSGGNGATCGGNNYVRRWQADAPSTVTNNNTLLYRCTNRNNVANLFTINHESWEEDGAPDCSSAGDACGSSGTWGVTFKSAAKTPNRYWAVNGTADAASFVTGQNGDFSAKTVWRFANGASCGNALNFGTLTNGTTYLHSNSNRTNPVGSSADLGYFNVSGNTANDVFYQFTLSTAASVVISTNNAGTNFDTYLRLFSNTSCGTQIAFNDDDGGTTSTITIQLCAGTYAIQVEGFSAGAGDFNLSVVANNITLTGGTIAGITNGITICSGTDPGAFTSAIDGNNGVGVYTYQWEQSTVSAVAGFANIGGANLNTYDPTTLTQTTWFRRRVTDQCGAISYSNVIQVVINTNSTPITLVSSTNPSCPGVSVTLSASGGITGTGGVINWYSGPNGTGTFIGTGASILVSPLVTTTYYVRREGTCNTTTDYTHVQNVTTPSTVGLATGDYVWNGSASNNWSTANNWFIFNGVDFTIAAFAPSSTSNVIIGAPSACSPNTPNTLTGTCSALNVTLLPGAFLTLGSGGSLTIEGFWINNSGVTTNVNALNNSTVIFSNSAIATKQIGGTTSTSFDNITNNSLLKVDINTETTVKNTLNLNGEFWLAERLILGTSPTSSGTLVITSANGFLAGPNFFRRYFGASTNSGVTGVFPMMAHPSYNYRGAKLEYISAPSAGGWIDGRFVSSTLSYYNGLPIINDSGVDINNYMNEGYWELIPGGGLTAGNYNLTLRYDGIGGINNPSLLRIIKSPMPHTTWVADGVHGGVVANEVIRNNMSGFSWFLISSNPINPLAVELANTSIECEENSTIIKWTTNSENEVHHFEIDLMENDANWKNITSILATGSINDPVSYEYTHTGSRNKDQYYRLSEFSNDGIKTILHYFKSQCEVNNGLSVYPNPTRGNFTVEYSNDLNSSSADVQLLDQHGKLLFESNVTLEKGVNFIPVQDLQLFRGTYFVRLILDNSSLPIRKIIIE